MSDEQGNTAPAGAETTSNADTGGTSASEQTNEQGGQANPTGSLMDNPDQGKPQADIPKNWPDNWRELLAGDGADDKVMNRLKRFKDPTNIFKSYLDLDKRISEGVKPLSLKEDSTPEEVAAYRKQMGIPDEPSGYDLQFKSENMDTEQAAEVVGRFKEFVHDKNLPPAVAQDVMSWYEESLTAMEQDRTAKVYETREETRENLIRDWGDEYKSNMAAVSTYLEANLGEDGKKALIQQRFEDGTFLGDNLHFMKMMAPVATDYVGPDAIFSGDVEQAGRDVDSEIAEHMKKLTGTPEEKAEYRSDDFQTNVMAPLFAKKEKIAKRRKK